MATQQQKPAPFGVRSFFDPNQNSLAPNPDQIVQPPAATPAASDSSAAPQMAANSSAPALPSMTPPAAPSNAPAATSTSGTATGPLSRDQFFSQNPSASSAFMPARPVNELDNVGGVRKGLALAMAGLASFGAGINHREDPTLGRWISEGLAQRQYDANQPRLKAEAENQAYGQYLQNEGAAANVRHTQQETNNAAQLNPAAQRKAQMLSQLDEELQKGAVPPEQLQAKYSRIANSYGINLTPEELQDHIQNIHAVGPKYQISQDKNGRPEFATDRQGNRIFPDAKGKFSDPELQSQWDSINSAHQASLDEEMQKEQRKADYAANAQGRAFQHAEEAADTRHDREEQDKGKAAAAKHLQTMREAQNQNELVQQLASSKSPTDQTSLAFKALGLDLPDGVHRINEAELHAIQNQGSLPDRAYKAILNWTTGQTFAPEILGDIKQTASRIAESKIKTSNDNLEDVNRLYGYKAPGSDERGRFDGKAAQNGGSGGQNGGAQNTAGAAQSNQPSPQTHKFSLSAWKAKNPKGDVKAAEAAARAQNFEVVP